MELFIFFGAALVVLGIAWLIVNILKGILTRKLQNLTTPAGKTGAKQRAETHAAMISRHLSNADPENIKRNGIAGVLEYDESRGEIKLIESGRKLSGITFFKIDPIRGGLDGYEVILSVEYEGDKATVKTEVPLS